MLEREKDLLKKSFENRYSQLQAQVQKLTALLDDKQKVVQGAGHHQAPASVPAPAHILPQVSAAGATVLHSVPTPTVLSKAERETQAKLAREVSYLRMVVDQSRVNHSLSGDYQTVSVGNNTQDLTVTQGAPSQQELVARMIRFAAGEFGLLMDRHVDDTGTLFENAEIRVELQLEKNLLLREGAFFLKGKLSVVNKTAEPLRNLQLSVKDNSQSFKMMVKPPFSAATLNPLDRVAHWFLASPRSPSVKITKLPVLGCSYVAPEGSKSPVSPIKPLALGFLPLGLHRYFLPDHTQSKVGQTTQFGSSNWDTFESEQTEILNSDMKSLENFHRLFGGEGCLDTTKTLTSTFAGTFSSSGVYRFKDFRLLVCLRLAKTPHVKVSVTYPKEFPQSLLLGGQVALGGVTPLDLARELADQFAAVFATDGH